MKNIPIKSNKCVDLANHHSFALNAYASQMFYLEEIAQLSHSNLAQVLQGKPYWLLGGGTNTLFLEDIKASIIKICLKGMFIRRETEEHIWVSAAAGECWDDFVSFTLEQGGFGLENLSLIPGTVGAAPIQNIGAYGVEVSEYIDSVVCYDFMKSEFSTLLGGQCGFGYRESRFKTVWRNRYLITEVIFRLPKTPMIKIEYPDLKNFFRLSDHVLTAAQVRVAIIEIRQKKLPDLNELANAGSFFKNPIISSVAFQKLKIKYPKIKGHPVAENCVKVAAGWLLEFLNFKVHTAGNFGCYGQQALILVNHRVNPEVNYGKDLLVYIKQIKDAVYAAFGVLLEVEPTLVDKHITAKNRQE